jgi:hypothetical protein
MYSRRNILQGHRYKIICVWLNMFFNLTSQIVSLFRCLYVASYVTSCVRRYGLALSITTNRIGVLPEDGDSAVSEYHLN